VFGTGLLVAVTVAVAVVVVVAMLVLAAAALWACLAICWLVFRGLRRRQAWGPPGPLYRRVSGGGRT
jgi:hypothetical protein